MNKVISLGVAASTLSNDELWAQVFSPSNSMTDNASAAANVLQQRMLDSWSGTDMMLAAGGGIAAGVLILWLLSR